MKTLYGLKIFASTPEGDYSYIKRTVYSSWDTAYNEKVKILDANYSNLIIRIDITPFCHDERRK